MVLATVFVDALPDELIQLIERYSGFVRGYKPMTLALKGKPECSIRHYSWFNQCWYNTCWSTPGTDAVMNSCSLEKWWLLPEPLENTLPITWYEFCRRRGQNGRLMLRENDEPPGLGGSWVNT